MARKPSQQSASRGRASGSEATPTGGSDREAIVNAFLVLLEEKRFEEIGLNEVAARAGVSLAELRDRFSSTMGMLAAYIKQVDRQVLAGGDADMAEEPPRERLFDVLMRRIEALTPRKQAIRSLMRSARVNPGLALALGCAGTRSQQWMLTAADIDASGPRGMIRAQGLAMLYARVLRVWVDDDDPGLARTMAALDRELARGQRWSGLLDDLCRLAPRPRWRAREDRRRTDADDSDAQVMGV
jgi:AcrR family transcriptional regulator